MRQGLFVTIVAVVALAISIVIYQLLPEYIKSGGPLVALLIMLSIMSVTFTLERLFTLMRAKGREPTPTFLRKVRQKIDQLDVEGAAQLCAKQRGSLANVLRAGLDRYAVVREAPIDRQAKIQEVQKAMEEANMLEVPLLERNLIALATIASIATMVGLLGTVIGMIRSARRIPSSRTVVLKCLNSPGELIWPFDMAISSPRSWPRPVHLRRRR